MASSASRLRSACLAWLAVLTVACSSDPAPPAPADGAVPPPSDDGEPGALTPDAAPGFDASVPPTNIDAGYVHRLPDGAVCVALGCDELGYECGQAVDNCGDPLNCNLEDNATPCVSPERCGGDPDLGMYKCGCKPRENPCEAQGAQCGLIDECGAQIDCGNCADGSLCLNNSCACTALPNPCGTRVCGQAPDGCGKMVACGGSEGACPTGACSPDGQCVCRPRAEVCVGQTGPVTENGCQYDCTEVPGGCVADNVAACAGAECGTALNNCGETVPCGASAGACAAGSTCVGPQFILDNALPARSATYQGGYCVQDAVARIVGRYAVRVHAYRQAGNTSINFINRAEAVSLVQIDYTRATATPQLTDYGCVATTVGDPSSFSGAGTRSVVPHYRKIKPAVMTLSLTPTGFVRNDVVDPVLGMGAPAGFVPGIPPYCVGFEGQSVALPQGDPRRDRWWPDNTCVCPTAADAARMPYRAGSADPNNYSSAPLRDCRISDDDGDGKPGFTARASALGLINSELYNANISHVSWNMTVREDRYHVGWSSDLVQPAPRVVLGCRETGGACAAPGVDCGCAERWSSVQFVPLADSATLDCDIYYSAPATASEAVNQNAIDTQFSVPFGTCSGPGECPANSLCRGNRCYPQTSRGACTSGSQNPCPPGTFCEDCPNDPGSPEQDTICRADTTCWPTSADCPIAGGTAGGLCAATPP